jgi:hypothetical protein
MKKLFFILTAIVLISGCEKKDNTCNCDDPMEDLLWMKEWRDSFTNCRCRKAIFQATYKNKETVFFEMMNDPLCDGWSNVILRDCKGNTVKVYPSVLDPERFEDLTDQKEIYFCKTYQ